MSRRLVADSALYTVANLASRLASLASLAILPILLDIQDYGIIGLVAAGAAFVNIIIPLEVSQGLARFYAKTPREEQPLLAGTAWWFTLAMLTAAAAVALILAEPLAHALFVTPGYQTAFMIAVVFWWGNCAFLFLQSQFRWSFRTRDYAIFSFGYAAAMLSGAVGLAILAPRPLLGAVGGWAAAALLVTALAYVSLRGTLAIGISRRYLRQMLRYALPLVPASVAIVITTYFSRILLGSKFGLAEVGLFTFASQLAAIPSFVILGLQSAVTPYVMANFDRPDTPALLARLLELVILFGLAGTFILAVVSSSILPVIGYSAYEGVGPLVLLLGPALLFQQLYIFAPGFAIAQRTGQQAIVSILAGALAVALNFWFIVKLGSIGAAFATLCSALFFIGAWFTLAHRYYAIPVRWKALLIATTMLAVVVLAGQISPALATVPAQLAGMGLAMICAAGIWWPAIKSVVELRSEN